jgi:hypothetical protein
MLAAVFLGMLIVGLPLAAVAGDEAGAIGGILAGIVIYLAVGSCPHCGKSTKPFAEVCHHCGRAK